MAKVFLLSMKRKVDILIFDLDGTLIDSRKDIANAVNHTRKLFNLGELDTFFIASHIGNGVKNLIQKSISELESKDLEKALKIFQEYYGEHCVEETTVYPGVSDVLKYYESKKMAVVSNKPSPFTERILKEKKLISYFQLILGEESHPKKKPDPASLLHVIEKLGGKPETSCMIGDWITDIEAGKRAGMITVGCLYGIGNQKELKEFQPDYLVDSILQLKDILE